MPCTNEAERSRLCDKQPPEARLGRGPGRMHAAARSNSKKATVTFAPISHRVLYDMEVCVRRFEVGDSHTFADFKAIWRAMRFTDIFGTARLAGRVPAYGETSGQYVRALVIAAGRHLLHDRYPEFTHRLGGLFLVFVLHSLQPCLPPVPVPVSQKDWLSILVLQEELDADGPADGLKALRQLRSGDCLEHTLEHNPAHGNIAAGLDAERAAAVLPARASVAELGPGPYAKRLKGTVASLEQLEQKHAAALAAAGVAAAAAGPRPLSESLNAALSAYASGQLVRHTTDAELEVQAVAENPAHNRRNAVRERAYAQRSSRSRGAH